MNCAKGTTLRRCAGIALMALVGIAALGWVVMLLWNVLLPSLFAGVSPVGYWQALGLLLLCKLLFGGFHGRGRRCRKTSRGDERLTADEKAQLKGFFNRRWSCGEALKPDDKMPETPKGGAQ